MFIVTILSTGCSKITKQITRFAWDIINREILNYESNPQVNIIDSKITRLELIDSFDALSVTSVDVYALEYRKPDFLKGFFLFYKELTEILYSIVLFE